jgi:hypothetical protein
VSDTPLLDRDFLERLERLTIHWQRSFAGLVGGHNRSRFAGGGQEFLDHRHFHQGDDLRAVNWRAFMRLDKMFLKMFQIEPRVPCAFARYLEVDGRARAKSSTYARAWPRALLCRPGPARYHSVLPFDRELHEGKVCGGGRHRYRPVAEFLEGLEPAGVHRLPRRRARVSERISAARPGHRDLRFSRRSRLRKALQYLADYGNELMLVQLWADEDRTPPWTGEVDFVDAESGARLRIHVDDEARRNIPKPSIVFRRSERQWRCATMASTWGCPPPCRSKKPFSEVW